MLTICHTGIICALHILWLKQWELIAHILNPQHRKHTRFCSMLWYWTQNTPKNSCLLILRALLYTEFIMPSSYPHSWNCLASFCPQPYSPQHKRNSFSIVRIAPKGNYFKIMGMVRCKKEIGIFVHTLSERVHYQSIILLMEHSDIKIINLNQIELWT